MTWKIKRINNQTGKVIMSNELKQTFEVIIPKEHHTHEMKAQFLKKQAAIQSLKLVPRNTSKQKYLIIVLSLVVIGLLISRYL